jgi:hypothetical protein
MPPPPPVGGAPLIVASQDLKYTWPARLDHPLQHSSIQQLLTPLCMFGCTVELIRVIYAIISSSRNKMRLEQSIIPSGSP